ncbi:MAG: hypothetical protein AMK69_21005 [Nitrospira bacterium SG8_3]|nr:MAG: hypothetical protein AMK69_21005 [Nitrospira bacterium SG8_3]
MADKSYDVVCVGAGNKNLVAACYALKYGGLSVGLFDERHEAGAGWSTEESPAPGFLANHCSQVHLMNYYTLFFEDFPEIDQMVERSYPPLYATAVFPDGTWIGQYSIHDDPNQERTAKSIARFSERDAETYVNWHRTFRKYWLEAWLESQWSPPPGPGEVGPLEKVFRNPEAGLDPAWRFMSMAQIMADIFESLEMQLLGLRGVQSAGPMPDEPGLGLVGLTMLSQREPIIIRGGNHGMAHACARVIQRHGGKIFTNKKVEKILIENGRARGIRLVDGTEIEAKVAVLSGVNPSQLVFDLTGPEHWSPRTVRRVKNLQSHMTCISWYTWALQEHPNYIAEDFDPDLHQSVWMNLGGKDINYVLNEVWRRRMGQWPDPEKFNLIVSNYSIIDPTFAPPGKSAILTEQYVLPATAFSEEEWKEIAKRHADEIIRFWGKYAPNVNWDNVIGYVPVTPHFTLKHSSNYGPSGNWHIIDLIPCQVGPFRPTPELANIRNFPIKNLYPASAAWGLMPGANACQGYVAYKVMAEHFDLPRPWEERGRPY